MLEDRGDLTYAKGIPKVLDYGYVNMHAQVISFNMQGGKDNNPSHGYYLMDRCDQELGFYLDQFKKPKDK